MILAGSDSWTCPPSCFTGSSWVVSGGTASTVDNFLLNPALSITITLRNHAKTWIRDLVFALPKNYRWYDRFRTHKPYQYIVLPHRADLSTRRMQYGFSKHQHRLNKRKWYIQSLQRELV